MQSAYELPAGSSDLLGFIRVAFKVAVNIPEILRLGFHVILSGNKAQVLGTPERPANKDRTRRRNFEKLADRHVQSGTASV